MGSVERGRGSPHCLREELRVRSPEATWLLLAIPGLFLPEGSSSSRLEFGLRGGF